MIVKPYQRSARPADRRQRAGVAAERQLAHYLHRGFSQDQGVLVLHGLRIEDTAQPEHTGAIGVCQIDHLVVHRFGLFIIESKSVTQEVRVGPDGSGGDEWTRVRGRKETGMPSPIRQAQMQADFLRKFLNQHKKEMLGRFPVGLRAFGRLVAGTDQAGFARVPIQLVVAVSDEGRITRLDGWKEPKEPFRVFVAKSDLVVDKIRQEINAHRDNAKLTKMWPRGKYGMWNMKETEAQAVAEFLAGRHVEPPGASAAQPAPAECRHCGSTDLTARRRYSHYWHCHACEKNTPMPAKCPACGAGGRHDNRARIRKDKQRYFLDCRRCDTERLIWVED